MRRRTSVPPLETGRHSCVVHGSVRTVCSLVFGFTNMAEWSNEKNIEFVEDYRSFPCLWMASSPEYKDRVKRSDRLQFLKNKYDMGTTKAALNKIKSLRSYFRRVHNEYLSKKKCGSRTIDVQKPSWFLYELLLFILDVEEAEPGIDMFTFGSDITEELDISRNTTHGRGVLNANPVRIQLNQDARGSESANCMSIKEELTEEFSWIHADDDTESQMSTHPQSVTNATCTSVPPSHHSDSKRMRLNSVDNVHFDEEKEDNIPRSSNHSYKEDEFDLFGKFIASQLRNLSLPRALRIEVTIQRLIAHERLKDIVSCNNVPSSDSVSITGPVSSSSSY